MPEFSVIIPVHNEAVILGRLLDDLIDGDAGDAAEIVVVCNGCTDDSAAVAASCGTRVRVVETDVADKPHALRLGDAAATAFPRFYVDADVRTSLADLRQVARQLMDGKALVAAPRLRVDTSHSSRLVRAYYRVWMTTPWVRDELVGSGVYALSKEAHERMGGFHTAGADDLWVSAHFAVHERLAVHTASFTVPASRDLRSLVRRRARILAANTLVAGDVSLLAGRPARSTNPVELVRNRPLHTPHVALYLLVQVAARALARRYVAEAQVPWNGDDRAPVHG